MNSVRYDRGYDGSNECTWRGYAYIGPEILEIRHGGIQVLTGSAGEGAPRAGEVDPGSVLEVGHIPWSWIDDIDPNGNEYDGSAIFFVRFAAPGRSPFNYHTYVDRQPTKIGPFNRDYYLEREEYGTRRPRFFADWWKFLRRWREDRRMNKMSRALQAGR